MLKEPQLQKYNDNQTSKALIPIKEKHVAVKTVEWVTVIIWVLLVAIAIFVATY